MGTFSTYKSSRKETPGLGSSKAVRSSAGKRKQGKSMGSDPVSEFDTRMKARTAKAKEKSPDVRRTYTNPYGRTLASPTWVGQPAGGKTVDKYARKAPLWDYGSKTRQADLDRDRKYWESKQRVGVRQSPLQPVIVPFGRPPAKAKPKKKMGPSTWNIKR